jgi:hypothetical protein
MEARPCPFMVALSGQRAVPLLTKSDASGSEAMNIYRVFVKDSGHINSSHRISADSDEDAVEKARQFLSGSLRVEVWQDNRFVARVDLAADG